MAVLSGEDRKLEARHFIVTCECQDPDHELRFVWNKHNTDYLFVTIRLIRGNLIERIMTALKFIFCKDSTYGDFDEILINNETAGKLVNELMEYCEYAKANEGKRNAGQ